jgi:hypothetical protein
MDDIFTLDGLDSHHIHQSRIYSRRLIIHQRPKNDLYYGQDSISYHFSADRLFTSGEVLLKGVGVSRSLLQHNREGEKGDN